MVKIRLRRTGKKKQASYRVVVADSRSPRDGRFIENLGHYNPRTDPETVVIDRARALYWLGNGAQPTEAVERLLRKEGVYEALPRYHAGEDPNAIFAEAEEAGAPETLAPAPAREAEQTEVVTPPVAQASATQAPEAVTVGAERAEEGAVTEEQAVGEVVGEEETILEVVSEVGETEEEPVAEEPEE